MLTNTSLPKMFPFNTISITFFGLLGLVLGVPTESTIVEHSLFRRGDPTVDCWRPDKTQPCIWLSTERGQYTTIHPEPPATIDCGGNIYAKTCKVTNTISQNGKQYAWIDFMCLGQRYEKKTRSGATIRFEDGKTMKVLRRIGDSRNYRFEVVPASQSGVLTVNVLCDVQF